MATSSAAGAVPRLAAHAQNPAASMVARGSVRMVEAQRRVPAKAPV